MPRRHRPPCEPPAALTRGEADRILMRKIVDMFETWRWCYRPCRRRKGCASATVRCFDHNIETAGNILERLANWRRLDGPRELDELVEPVGEFVD
jgi:hypothetical protein